jgi:hypothetical protein
MKIIEKYLHTGGVLHCLATCHLLEVQLLNLSLGHLTTLSNGSSVVTLFIHTSKGAGKIQTKTKKKRVN